MATPAAAFLALAAASAFLALAAAPAVAQNVPANFVVEDVAPGAGFVTPVGVTWLPDGRMLVIEKRGRIQVVKNGIKNAQPMWQGDNEVLDQQDRGFLGLAVDPKYFVNHYIYLLYTVDSDSDGVDTNAYGFGRLTRYTVNFTDSNTVISSSRLILMGTGWKDSPEELSPSHTIGTVRFAKDGSLLVGAGDGANFDFMDPGGYSPTIFGNSPNKIDPIEDIGAFRSQYVNSLCGKILRINPATGHGYASNPYADSNLGDKRSKVWVYGLRNPYRWCLRPGTGSTDTSLAQPGTLYIGDVGWATWEEMDIVKTDGLNLGWPCYESAYASAPYQSATPSHNDCSSYGTSTNPAFPTAPNAWWNHVDGTGSSPVGLVGNASIGGAFYTGTRYPAADQGKYFFMDYGAGWIKIASVDASDNLLSVTDFGDAMAGPVDLEADPANGDLIYVSIYTSEVRRIRYVAPTGNQPPVAHAQASPGAGIKPLAVNFTSTGTFDPDGDPMTLSWNFGDGQGATGASASHTYPNAGTYGAVLTAADSLGGIGRDTVLIVVSNATAFPTTGILDSFNRANGPMGASWGDANSSLAINANQLTQTASTWNDAVWEAQVFGPTQEAYYTFNAITATAPEHDLEFKVQGSTWDTGMLELKYDATQHNVIVNTYDGPAQWRGWATIPVTFVPGDQFGGRAYANGTVEVFRNGSVIGSANVTQWPYYALGGHIGLEMALATSSQIDNFGGGDAILNVNTPPIAFITSPLDSTFYATGDTIRMRGYAHDAQDSANALTYRWEVDLHHNNHVHPNSFTSDSASYDIIGENDDDGTGVFLLIRYIVTDTGGLRDSVYAHIFPRCDLTPGPVFTDPTQPGTTTPSAYAFKIYNPETMPAHIFHWILMSDEGPLAAGDTLVAAHDSVMVYRLLPPTMSAGAHVLRAVVDTLIATGADSIKNVVETNEANNVSLTPITVILGPGTLDAPGPGFRFALSNVNPNPGGGRMMLTLELPRESNVAFDVIDVQGRRVWRGDPRNLAPGLWPLRWDGRDALGVEAHPGLYLARVVVDGRAYVRRFVVLR